VIRIQSFAAGKHHVLRNGEHLVSAVFRAPQTAGRNFEVRTGGAGGEMRELRNVPFTVRLGFTHDMTRECLQCQAKGSGRLGPSATPPTPPTASPPHLGHL
jgi:hypothetical protein